MNGTQAGIVQVETRTFKRVAWSAVFAGVVVTLIIQTLLSLLGIGIGAASVEPMQQTNPGKGLGIGAAIWFFICTLIAVYCGARVAGRMSAAVPKSERMLHGILSWATSAMFGVLALTTAAGSLVGGAASFLGTAAATNQGMYSMRQESNLGMSSDMSRSNLSPTGRDAQNPQNQAQYEQQARAAGDVAARRVSQAAWWSFFVLLLSGIVAGIGAGAGTTNRRDLSAPGNYPSPAPGAA